MKGSDELKTAISKKVLVGISVAAVAVVVGLLVYFLRASDPAGSPPVPYKKFDYGAHMQQTQPADRQAPSASSSSPGSPTTP